MTEQPTSSQGQGSDEADGKAKPPMPAALEPFAKAARKRVARRPASPGVVYEGDDWQAFGAPHANKESWRDQILDAFGTRSGSIAEVFLGQLADLFRREWNESGQERSQLELNAVLSFINGIRPRNEVEASLAAQMAAVHVMTMRLSGRALLSYDPDPAGVSLAGKMARTFAMQIEALGKLRGRRSRQNIRVERHVHNHQHVHVSRGAPDNGDQPHEPNRAAAQRCTLAGSTVGQTALEHAGGAALPRDDPESVAMPSASDQK